MRVVLFGLMIFAFFGSAQSVVAQNNLKLGSVRSFDDSGDSIWLSGTKEKDRTDANAIAIFGYGGTGKININGRDIELKQGPQDLPDENFKVGKGGFQVWTGKDVIVRLDYVFTWLCPEAQENCSVYYYKGKMDIFYQGQRRKLDVVGFGGS